MNLNDIKIIPMSINNIDKVKDIETDQNINILSKESILNDIKDEHSCYFVAILDKEIVGYIASSIVIDNMDLESIVVKKEYQRMHIASYLLDFLFNLAKKKNVVSIFLEVRTSNIKAQNLYRKYGFEIINIRKKYYKENLEDAFIMKKDL